MSLFDRLSIEDIEKIKYYTDYIGLTMKADIDYVLRFWNKNKEGLGKLFGEGLIIQKEVNYKKPKEEVENDFHMKIQKHNFFRDFSSALRYNETLSNFEKNNINQLLYMSNLIDNRYIGCDFSVINPKDGKIVKVQNGSKTMRILSKFAEMLDVDGFEDFRIAQSQLVNEKNIRGTLCLSIHPLDFMTMSDNNCGWSSCMSWLDQGDYCQGTIEMMNSPIVVCAYLKSATDFTLNSGEFSWNSKRWRELFIIDKRVGIYGIKGYPYWNKEIEAITLNWIKDLLEENNYGFDLEDKIYKYGAEDQAIYTSDYTPLSGSAPVFETSMMYNDFCYNKHHCIPVRDRAEEIEYIHYSGETECIVCGDGGGSVETENHLTCYDCDPYIYCTHCGERIRPEDAYSDGENYFCNTCYEHHFRECDCCQEVHYKDFVRQVKLVYKDYLYNYVVYLCENCEDNFNIHTIKLPYHNRIDCIKIEELIENNQLNIIGSTKEDLDSFIVILESKFSKTHIDFL